MQITKRHTVTLLSALAAVFTLSIPSLSIAAKKPAKKPAPKAAVASAKAARATTPANKPANKPAASASAKAVAAAPKPAQQKAQSRSVAAISAASPGAAFAGGGADKAVEVRGQARTLSMMLVLRNGKENINFIKPRTDYVAEINGTQF